MGMDVTFGVLYGAKVRGYIVSKEATKRVTVVTRYNPVTGEPHQEDRVAWEHTLLVDLGDHHTGELLKERAIEDIIYGLVQDHRYDGMYYVDGILGFKAFLGEAPYYPPQDMSFELKLDVLDAQSKWHELCPEIPGKLYMYLHASY